MLYLLSTHPHVKEKIITEVEEVLGPVNQADRRIIADPSVLNKLPYLTAAIRESLRLSGLAQTIRSAPPGFVQ